MPLVLKDEEVKQLEGLINATPYGSAVSFINFFQGIAKKRQDEANAALNQDQVAIPDTAKQEPQQSNG